MKIEEAKKLLNLEELPNGYFRNRHNSNSEYINWYIKSDEVTLDGSFTADELEAMSVLMRVLKE